MRLVCQNDDPEGQGVRPSSGNRRMIHATCQTHGGARGFCNLLMTKNANTISFDSHVTGACVIELDEGRSTVVRDAITEWLGD